MGAIGFLDDNLKLTKGKEGLAAKYKIIGQVGLGLLVGTVLFFHRGVTVRVTEAEARQFGYEIIKPVKVETPHNSGKYETMCDVKGTITNLPFWKNGELDYASFLPMPIEEAHKWAWLIFIPMVVLIVTAVSNAANLTDGIDGLAGGVSAIVGITLGILVYVSGSTFFSDYLDILYIPQSGELTVFTAAFIGACTGFLWYNAYPAQVFMGDTGSLTLGGIIAALAIIIRKELLIPVLCGVFLVENLSVVLQVMVFKYRKRKYGLEYAQNNRLFKMSPLHHHFQKEGYHESKIVMRFFIVSIMLAIITLITLKIR
jgi:phospho-N-acetylmuramoyl-pentapeptide-transferase